MNSKLYPIAAVLLQASSAFAIEPAPCEQTILKAWRNYRLAVTKAEPNSPLFVPHPFPSSNAEVLEDFHFTYSRMFGAHAPGKLPPGERAVWAAIRTGRVGLVVERVENWGPTRCTRIERQWDYVVRVFSHEGEELGRYALGQSGLFAQASVPPPTVSDEALQGWRREFLTANESRSLIRRVYGISGSEPKLVSLGGDGDLWCESTHPCTVLSSGNRSFVLGRIVPWLPAGAPPQLYEHRTDYPRFSPAEVATPEARASVLRSLDPGARLVSIASQDFLVVVPVDPISNSLQ